MSVPYRNSGVSDDGTAGVRLRHGPYLLTDTSGLTTVLTCFALLPSRNCNIIISGVIIIMYPYALVGLASGGCLQFMTM